MFFPFFFVFFFISVLFFSFSNSKTLDFSRSFRAVSMLAFTISLCTALSSHNAQRMSNRVVDRPKKTSSIYPFSPGWSIWLLLYLTDCRVETHPGSHRRVLPHQISCPSQSPIVNVSFTISFSPSFSFSAINRHINSINRAILREEQPLS